MTDQYYKKFKITSTIISSLSESLIQNDVWERNYGLDTCIISDKIWCKEPLLATIDSRFPIDFGFLIKIPPNTSYNWHVDGTRAAGINLKLTAESLSHTLFGTPLDEWNDKFIELNYDNNSFYLLNTQQKHCVINFDKYRYMFSLQFVQNKDIITYQDIYNWCSLQELFDE